MVTFTDAQEDTLRGIMTSIEALSKQSIQDKRKGIKDLSGMLELLSIEVLDPLSDDVQLVAETGQEFAKWIGYGAQTYAELYVRGTANRIAFMRMWEALLSQVRYYLPVSDDSAHDDTNDDEDGSW
jgi:hypothetical protein